MRSLTQFFKRLGTDLMHVFRRMGTARIVALSALIVVIGLGISIVGTNWPEDIVYGSPMPTNTPSDVAAFVSTQEASPSIGYRVFFNDVKVRSGPAADVYLLGESGKRQLVLLWTDDNKPEMRDARIADVSGVIHATPSVDVLRSQWKLTKKQDRERVSESPVYIVATKVTFHKK